MIRAPKAGRHRARPGLCLGLVLGLMIFHLQPFAVRSAPNAGPRAQNPPGEGGRDGPAESLFIRAGTIETISHGTLRNGALLIRGGQIVAVGDNLVPPPGTQVLAFPTGVLTPGLIETAAGAGLSEIDMEKSTVDIHAASASDPVRAAFRAADAFNPRSLVIPIARSGGVTSIVAMPTGGFVSGISMWADLGSPSGARAVEAYSVRRDAALYVVLGLDSAQLLGGSRGLAFLRLRELFEDAELYSREKDRFRTNRLRALGASLSDLRALSGVRSARMPVVFRANRADDIVRAVRSAAELGLRAVILGGTEAHLVARELSRTRTPVILNSLDNQPADFDRLHAVPDNAARLHRAGVPVVLSTLDALDFRHRTHVLRLIGGNAARFGMPRNAALRSMTLEAANTFGMSATHGSLQTGRVANLVVWSGDPLEISSSVTAIFIRGHRMSLDSRQRRLLEKYRKSPRP